MNEHMGYSPSEDGGGLPASEVTETEQTDPESSEKNEALTVDNVFFGEVIAQNIDPDREEKMILYTPQEEIAKAKRSQYEQASEYSTEPTTLTLSNPLRLTLDEYVTQWQPGTNGDSWAGMRMRIKEAMEAGHDGLAVEADPDVAQAKAAGKYPTNQRYTFATESYFKFSGPESKDNPDSFTR